MYNIAKFLFLLLRLWIKGEIPKGILGSLTQLRTLNLDNNQLSGNISWMFKFNNSLLKDFNLGYNNLSGNLPSKICEGFPNLMHLILCYNDLSGDMPSVWHQCKELQELELSYNSFNKGPIPGDIQNMTNLQYIRLCGNNLEGKIFAFIKDVIVIWLNMTWKRNIFLMSFLINHNCDMNLILMQVKFYPFTTWLLWGWSDLMRTI